MFLRLFCFVRRPAWLAVAAGAGLFAIPNSGCSQGISLTGVGEGGVISLPANVATTNLSLTATPSSPSGSTNVAFILERQGSILLTRTSPPPYSTTFTNLTAGKYFLTATLAATGSPPNGNVSFDIQAAPALPPNDKWSLATVLPTLNTTVASTNTYATSEPNEPVHAGIGAGKSIWWSWNAVSNGVFTATTAGSGFDTVLAVYRGTNLNTLAEIAASDDAGPNAFSQVTFHATNGVNYYFAVDSAPAAADGKVQLRLVAGSPPAISITSPVDGLLFLVQLPSQATNTQAAASINDPAGIARVEYWFDGGPDVSRSGILSPPYQLALTNLLPHHYVLTFAASNNLGLVSLTNAGLSVISLAPELTVDRVTPSSGKFVVGVTGFKRPKYALEASTNLEVWCSVNTWTNFPGAEKVADTNTALFNRRFYRARSSP